MIAKKGEGNKQKKVTGARESEGGNARERHEKDTENITTEQRDDVSSCLFAELPIRSRECRTPQKETIIATQFFHRGRY